MASLRCSNALVADRSHLLDMLIDRRVFLYVGIGRRHVGLGLIVVVVRDEVFHGVVREEFLEFAVQLGRQGFVRRHDQRWTLQPLDHIGDRVRFYLSPVTPRSVW